MRSCNQTVMAGLMFCASWVYAADEIQVYQGDLRAPGESGVEIHMNYTPKGSKEAAWDGQTPSQRSFNITPEFSWHLAENMDWGLYLPLTRAADGGWMGNGLKGRLKYIDRLGDEDNNRFYGINFELAHNKISVDEAKWSSEIRLIAGRETSDWIIAANAMLGHSLSGPDHSSTPDLGLNATVLRKLGNRWSWGLEHHMELGRMNDLQAMDKSPQQTFVVANYESKQWGLHVGLGQNWTSFGDKTILKAILGFDF